MAAGLAYDYRALDGGQTAEADAIDRWLAFEAIEPPAALQFETRYAVDDWLARSRQQPNNPASVPSRFDGVIHSHNLSSELQLHAFAGVPKDNPTPAHRTLYGLGVDLKAAPPHWHGSAWGEPWRPDMERGTQVKGATLTALQVARHGEGWEARCVVDL